jgi:hypothetical protein
MTKTPMTIQEGSRGCLTFAGETSAGGNQALCMSVQVPRKLGNAMGIMPRQISID